MKCINAIKFHRKSGVAEWRDLQFSGLVLEMFFGALRLYGSLINSQLMLHPLQRYAFRLRVKSITIITAKNITG
jgi:hypothetical protein